MRNRCWGAERYEATVGDLFAVVPPPDVPGQHEGRRHRRGVTLRRISVKGPTEGILMPEEKVEGRAHPGRCGQGGPLAPARGRYPDAEGMLPRHKYADYMVVSAGYAGRTLPRPAT